MRLSTRLALVALVLVTLNPILIRSHDVPQETKNALANLSQAEEARIIDDATQSLEAEAEQLDELPGELVTKELDATSNKLFDYESFKKLFHKHYESITEELARQKLFLARSLRAYISGIKYKFRFTNYFYSVNPMSDWTQIEIDKSDQPSIDPLKAPGGENIKVLTLKDYEQWKRDHVQRERRSNPEARDEFSMDELIEDHIDATEPPEIAAKMVDDPFKTTGESVSQIGTGGSWWNPFTWSRYWFGEPESVKQQPSSGYSNYNYNYLQPNQYQVRRRTDDLVYVDHRRSKCFHVAQNQGKCGGCYAFALTAFYEWAYCQETGKLPKFSEQYILDCGPILDELEGCRQGIANTANLFTHRYGLELANYYPYKGVSGRCPYDLASKMPQEMGYIRVDTLNVVAVPLQLVDHFLPFTPMQMNIDSRGGYREYGGGVHDGSKCGQHGSHSMLLVGSGRQDGVDYWLFRNSHSPAYGEDGYYKMDKRADCIHPRYGFIFGTRDGKKVSLFARKNNLRDPNVIHSIQDVLRYKPPFNVRETYLSGHSEHRLVNPKDNLRISYLDD